ncbi:hypothetical protein D3C71_2082760 [compost metagenome]
MRCEQIDYPAGVPLFQLLVGSKRIAHFLDFPRQTQYTLASEHSAHLLQRQSVVLDGQGGMNGTDTVIAAQMRRQRRRAHH